LIIIIIIIIIAHSLEYTGCSRMRFCKLQRIVILQVFHKPV